MNFSADIYIDFNNNVSSFAPVGYPSLATNSSIDQTWMAAAHVYNPFLFQTRLAYNTQNVSQTTIGAELWIKEDLSYNGMDPTLTSNLYSI